MTRYCIGACDSWICEYDPQTSEAYGYTCIGDTPNADWGYIPSTELEQTRIGPGCVWVIERDLHWKPVPLNQVRHACGG